MRKDKRATRCTPPTVILQSIYWYIGISLKLMCNTNVFLRCRVRRRTISPSDVFWPKSATSIAARVTVRCYTQRYISGSKHTTRDTTRSVRIVVMDASLRLVRISFRPPVKLMCSYCKQQPGWSGHAIVQLLHRKSIAPMILMPPAPPQ